VYLPTQKLRERSYEKIFSAKIVYQKADPFGV
jgi:hypothetical protein